MEDWKEGRGTAIGPGSRVGMLTVRERTRARKGGCVVWRCACDCGGEILLDTRALRRGAVRDCGCGGARGAEADLSGQRFGALVVTGYAGRSGGKRFWNCRCDCGGEAVVCQSNLRSGHTKSCGCLRRAIPRENLKLVDGTSVVLIERRKRAPIKGNKSGVSGVYYNRKRERWCAQITFKGKTYFLGDFEDRRDAVRARQRGEEMYDDFLAWYYGQGPR